MAVLQLIRLDRADRFASLCSIVAKTKLLLALLLNEFSSFASIVFLFVALDRERRNWCKLVSRFVGVFVPKEDGDNFDHINYEKGTKGDS